MSCFEKCVVLHAKGWKCTSYKNNGACVQGYSCDFSFNLKMQNFPRMSEKEKAFLFSDGHFENRVFHQRLLLGNVNRMYPSCGVAARTIR